MINVAWLSRWFKEMTVERRPEMALQKRQFSFFLTSILIADELWSLQWRTQKKEKENKNTHGMLALGVETLQGAPPSGSWQSFNRWFCFFFLTRNTSVFILLDSVHLFMHFSSFFSSHPPLLLSYNRPTAVYNIKEYSITIWLTCIVKRLPQ